MQWPYGHVTSLRPPTNLFIYQHDGGYRRDQGAGVEPLLTEVGYLITFTFFLLSSL